MTASEVQSYGVQPFGFSPVNFSSSTTLIRLPVHPTAKEEQSAVVLTGTPSLSGITEENFTETCHKLADRAASATYKYDDKVAALDSLIALLQSDPLTLKTAHGLIPLVQKLMKQMDSEVVQGEVTDVRIKLATALGLAVENVLRQRNKNPRNLDAITKEFKTALNDTMKLLESLNRSKDPALRYAVQYAQEGIKRLTSNENKLVTFLTKTGHIFNAISALSKRELGIFISEMGKALENLDLEFTSKWYEVAFAMKTLAREATTDQDKLLALQAMILHLQIKPSWQLNVTAIQALTLVTTVGESAEIRRKAFVGVKNGKSVPGVIDFQNFSSLVTKNLLPNKSEPKADEKGNAKVKENAVRALIEITLTHPDAEIRYRAKFSLVQLGKAEGNSDIGKLIAAHVPTSLRDQQKWLAEDTSVQESPPTTKVVSTAPPVPTRPAAKATNAANQALRPPSPPKRPAPQPPHNATSNHTHVSTRKLDTITSQQADKLAEEIIQAKTAGKVLLVEFSNLDSYNELGKALKRQGRYDDAIYYYTQGINQNPNNPERKRLLHNRAVAKRLNNDLNSAMKDYRQVLVIDPELFESLLDLACIYSLMGNITAHIEYAQKATKVNPNSPKAHFSLALGFMEKYNKTHRLHDLQLAETSLRTVLNLSPNDSEAMASLQKVQTAKGFFTKK